MSAFQDILNQQMEVYLADIKKQLNAEPLMFNILKKEFDDRWSAMTDDEKLKFEMNRIIRLVHYITMKHVHDSLFSSGEYCDREY